MLQWQLSKAGHTWINIRLAGTHQISIHVWALRLSIYRSTSIQPLCWIFPARLALQVIVLYCILMVEKSHHCQNTNAQWGGFPSLHGVCGWGNQVCFFFFVWPTGWIKKTYSSIGCFRGFFPSLEGFPFCFSFHCNFVTAGFEER